tara:strand:- start:1111 stop:1476 length:366 start_codon:yes stop_codon:yes gene_type:complete
VSKLVNLKELKKEAEKILEDTPQAPAESTKHYEKRLKDKYPSLAAKIRKLSMAQKGAMWKDEYPWSRFGATPGYPAKGGTPPKGSKEFFKGGGKIKKNYSKGGGMVGNNKVIQGYKKGGQV